MTWIGKPMMDPEGNIGTVVNDNNWGHGRTLTVKFEDDSTKKLELRNVGANSKETQKWKWLYDHDGKTEWIEWGY